MLVNIREIVMSGKFPRAEVKVFWMDVDKGWNNFQIFLFLHVTTALHSSEDCVCIVWLTKWCQKFNENIIFSSKDIFNRIVSSYFL